MTWFRIDDGFHEHAKVEALEGDPVEHALAIAAWTLCGSACSRRLTDGIVTRAAFSKTLSAWPERLRAKASAALVRVGLWVEHEDGWRYHDWHDRNPSREDVLRERAVTAARQAEWKAKRRAANAVSNAVTDAVTDPVSNAVSDGVSNGCPVPSRPVPSRYEKDLPSASLRSGRARAPGEAVDADDGSHAGLAEGAWTRVVGERGGSYQAHPTRDARVLRAVAEVVLRGATGPPAVALEASARAFWAQRRSPRALPENWLEWLQREASAGRGAGASNVSPPEDFTPSPIPGRSPAA